MVARPPYHPPVPAPVGAPLRQAQQLLQLGLAPSDFPQPFRPKLPSSHLSVPQQYSSTVGGPQYFDFPPAGAATFIPEYDPAARTLQYPLPGIHPQQTQRYPGTVRNGVSDYCMFRGKRPQVLGGSAGLRPSVTESDHVAAIRQPISLQQQSLPAAPISRETFNAYRRIEMELVATAQREKDFARYVQSVEAKANNGRRPPAGSLSAMMQSLADKTAHLARCFEAYTRELSCVDGDIADGIGDSEAVFEEIVATSTSSLATASSTEGAAASEDAAARHGEVVHPAGRAPGVNGVAEPTPRGHEIERVLAQGLISVSSMMSSSASSSVSAATLAEDLMKFSVTPAPKLFPCPSAVDQTPVVRTHANLSAVGAATAETRSKVVAPPLDSRRARPLALPCPLPEFSAFSHFTFEPASAPARLVEEDELYSCSYG